MGYRIASFSFLFYVILLSQCCTHSNGSRKIKEMYDLLQQTALDENNGIHAKHAHDDHLQMIHDHHPSSQMEPSLNIFFSTNDLKVGKSIPIYFSRNSPSSSPHFLPKEESDSIPFSLSQLQNLLDFFSFPKHSPQAKAMEYTLSQCELQPLKGETKFCSTSLESMLDLTSGIFGSDSQFKVLNTKHLSRHTVVLQNYTVLEKPTEILTPKIVACHSMPYPYAVFYCHVNDGGHKVYEVLLGGDDGERVEALGVCHVDTSQWDPNHVAFRVLKTQPGRSPVCHFFPADNLIWVASPSIV